MTTMLDRLRIYLGGGTTRLLASAGTAPAALLAGCSGAAIAALVGVPNLASTGVGVVIGGIAVNVASSLLQTLVKLPPDDDDGREALIVEGLAVGDAGVQQAVAAALVAAGPELAQALPPAQREALIAKFEQGLHALGGAPAAVAPRFAANLSDPSADWEALKDELRASIASVKMSASVRKGNIRDLQQEVREQRGSVDMRMHVDEGDIIGGSQVVANSLSAHTPSTATRSCPDCGASVPANAATCPSCGLPLNNPARGSPAETLLTLSFAPSDEGAMVRWEAQFIGAETSRFVSPYPAAELPLLTRALDVLQFLNYPLGHDEPTRRWFTFSDEEQKRLTAWGLWDAAKRVDASAHRAVGRALYAALIADPKGRSALSAMRNKATDAAQPLALRLRFAPGDVALAALPWELLWPPDEDAPLLLSRGQLAACTRHLDLPQALPPIFTRREPLRVLAICPNADIPSDVRHDERAARMAELQPLIDAGQIVLREVSPATRRAVVDAVQSFQPDAIHFYGHGHYQQGRGALLLDRERDGTPGNDGRDWTDVNDLAVMLGGVRLALLFACQGAMATEGGVLTGVAPALCAANVPLVVAMQLATRIAAATRASGTIYRALVAGRSLQAAVGEARQALFVDEADKASWYVPTLYLRSGEAGPVYVIPKL